MNGSGMSSAPVLVDMMGDSSYWVFTF